MSGSSTSIGVHPEIPDHLLVQWQRLCLLAARATGAAAAHVVERAGSNLVTRAAAGARAGELSVLAGDCDRAVLEACEPLVLEDTAGDRRGHVAAQGGAGAYVGLPLSWPDGEVFGVIAVLHESPRLFAAADHETLVVAAAALSHDLTLLAAGAEASPAESTSDRGSGARNSDLREEFFASVVHELRTPIVSILGASEALLGGMAGRITDSQQRLLEVVGRGGDRMVRLVDNLRELVRLESGHFSVARQPMDFREPVRQALAALRPVAENASVQLAGDLPTAEVRVNGDNDRLAQVATNLIENAVRHARRTVCIVMREDQGMAELMVADDGPGVPAADAESLFEPWHRHENSHGRPTAHLGLGLTIVRHLVEAHDGTVQALSPPPPLAAAPLAGATSGFACIVRLPLAR